MCRIVTDRQNLIIRRGSLLAAALQDGEVAIAPSGFDQASRIGGTGREAGLRRIRGGGDTEAMPPTGTAAGRDRGRP
jgi:hypothetical protein